MALSALPLLALRAEVEPTPTPSAAVWRAEDALRKAERELAAARDAWDRSKLETQLYHERYQRAYAAWVASRGKDAEIRGSLRRRSERAEAEWRIAREKRRRRWYLYEAARLEAEAARLVLEAARHVQGAERTARRIQKMQADLRKAVEEGGSP